MAAPCSHGRGPRRPHSDRTAAPCGGSPCPDENLAGARHPLTRALCADLRPEAGSRKGLSHGTARLVETRPAGIRDMIDKVLLEILACPETKEPVDLAEQELVDRISARVDQGDEPRGKSRGGEDRRGPDAGRPGSPVPDQGRDPNHANRRGKALGRQRAAGPALARSRVPSGSTLMSDRLAVRFGSSAASTPCSQARLWSPRHEADYRACSRTILSTGPHKPHG